LHPSLPAAEAAARRAAITREVTEATGLDRPTITAFLRAFYDAARRDPLLGPAFAGVADWEAHIAQLTRFWSSVALMSGDYHGQPMQAHAHLALTPDHFARWLALFERIAGASFSPEGARHMVERARRIARSLEMGLIPLPLPARPRHTAPGDHR
jgi:hemoglobin